MTSTSLDAVLRNEAITTIVATGVSINVAVLGLAFEGVNRGYQVVVPRDATAGVDEQYVDAVYANTLSLIATVTTTAALVDVWSDDGAVRRGSLAQDGLRVHRGGRGVPSRSPRFPRRRAPEWWRGMFVDDERGHAASHASICRQLAERGWLTHGVAARARGLGGERVDAGHPARGDVGARGATRSAVHEPQLHRAAHHALRHARAAAALPSADGAWRGDLDAGVLRARRGLRSRVARDPRRGPRRPLRRQRSEDLVELRRRACRLVPCSSPAPDAAGAEAPGISVLLVDIETPGITVRPIDTMAGPHEFNEMFFDDVIVPHDCLLGRAERGWDLVRRADLRARRASPDTRERAASSSCWSRT